MEDTANRKELRAGERVDRKEMVRQFRASGLTRKAFATRCGVALSTLNYWLARIKREEAGGVSSGPVAFRELKVNASDFRVESNWAMEVVSRGGLTIRSRKPFSERVLIRLLGASGC